MSEKTHESSLDHDFGFSCHGVSSVCLGEATRGIGGASDVVFQKGSFGLVGPKYVPEGLKGCVVVRWAYLYATAVILED